MNIGPKTTEAKARYEKKINELQISDNEKDFMHRILTGIITSPRARLYVTKQDDFEEFLSLRENNSDEASQLEFCIVERMVNSYSGATEGRKYNYPSLLEVLKYATEHRDIIESELVNAENYQKRQSQVQTQAPTPQTPKEKFKLDSIQLLENLPNIPDYKKQRVIDVLEAIDVCPQSRLYSVQQDGYSEAISLKGNEGNFRYHVTKRWFDYAGSTIGREHIPLSVKGLAEYVEKNRIVIDKELKKMKKLYPELSSKTSTGQTLEDSDDIR